jgi:hypothetical protein
MMAVLLFVPPGNLGDWLMRGLAVIGASALGGFGAGLIVQLSARLMTTRKTPRPVLRLIRIGGAITCGLLVAMALFRTGGPGGGGSGEGGGKDAGMGPYIVSRDKDTAQPKNPPAGGNSLRIVVVPSADGHCYRIDGQEPAQTFDEVKALVAVRRAQATPLAKLVIVLYDDSPDQGTPIVQQLESLAQDNGLTPEISKPPGKAP